jgi:tetratricopeptide (TPR) repeat protein
MRDESLFSYLTEIACSLGGDHCPDIRVYPVRVPFFNASMAPNGMMQVWSGLLLRMENEAQLAAVIGHEIGHFLQRHSLERLRDIKARAAFGQFIGMFGVVGLAGQLASLAGAFAFSREHEREADRIGVALMRKARYDAREAAKVWGNLLDEVKSNPNADPSRNNVLFATHPPSDERRAALEVLAAGNSGETHEERYRARLAPWRFGLFEDELKRGQFFESLTLIERMLLREPGSAELLHFRGEARRQRNLKEDRSLALADFETAIATGRAPAESYRSLGYLHKGFEQRDAARQAWQQYLERAPMAADAALIKQAVEELR